MIRLCLLNKFKPKLSWSLILALVIGMYSRSVANSNESVAMGQLACNDDIQISLDETCTATITPEMVLEGTGYNLADMEVIARDWQSNAIIDIDPVTPGVQIGAAQIGKHLRLTVREISTGNSCWGRAFVEDKLAPKLTCPLDVKIECTEETSPAFTGEPIVEEYCGNYTLTYTDKITKGSCALGYERIIVRTWVATDASGNKSTCSQNIVVILADLATVDFPPHFDVVGRPTIFKHFTGPFIPGAWAVGNSGPGAKNGTANFTSNNTVLTIIGADGVAPAKMDTTFANLSIPYCGTITFDWQAFIRGGAGNFNNDEAGYSLNGVYTFLSTPPNAMVASGSTTVDVQAGDEFSFFVRSNNVGREDTFIVSNFKFVGCNQNALLCEQKINKAFDPTSHYLSYPNCVDGYLLDSFEYGCTGARIPRILGWNVLETGAFAGNPNPDPVYYPANPGCWPQDAFVMWNGTGRPEVTGCSNLAVTYKDIRIDIAKPGCDAGSVGCFKVLRQWLVLDWCTGGTRSYDQIIKVVDDKGPQVLYPDSLVVNTDVWKCEGRWEVPQAWVVDNCSSEVHYSIKVDDGTVLGNETSGYIVVNLPLGIQNAYIVAEDCCGNVTEKLVRINVIDANPPIAVCDQKTVVTITGTQSPGQNFAKINAETFDDGSFDNCANHIYFKAIRMDELDGTTHGTTKESGVCNKANGDDDLSILGSQTYFDDNVKFCCADVGTTVRVVFRVFDVDPGVGPVKPGRMASGLLAGHFSDCMVEVEVQDKSIPTVVAPPDMVVSCMFWFDLSKATDPKDSTFGKVVNDVAWRSKVKSRDIVCNEFCYANPLSGYPGPILGSAGEKACGYYNTLFNPSHPDNKYDLVWGFDGYVLASCNVTPVITVIDKRECGQGRILREISARGPNNILVKATQTIWVVDCDPFYIDGKDKCSTTDDITWPDCAGVGVTIDGCGADTSPDNPLLGRPRIENGADDNCALIAIEFKDEVFTIEPDACLKILRTWIVIDWCQYDPSKGVYDGRWEHTQVIKVRDLVKPVVTCNVGPCEPASINTTLGVCTGHIRLSATATDSCSPADWLSYEYKIDAFNNGSIDYTVGKLTRRAYANGDIPSIRNNPFADNKNNPFDASGTYPIGVHRITWYVEDGCGNIGICSTLFEVKDCKAPTPYCLTGIITVPMPSTGCIDIWAKDLNANSYDNCTPANKLKFYFAGKKDSTYMRVCCSDFVAAGANDELLITVQMWVEDEEGNRDYCTTTVIVQDNQNVCPNKSGSFGKITGEIKTESGDKTAQAETDLMMNGALLKTRTTQADGFYSFLDLTKTETYMVKPERNDNHLNGVTTADIVKMQKHILGVSELDSPFKLIAADVNKSESITAADMAEIRRLILGIQSEFTKTASWTFIPKSYVFADPSNPWKYEDFASVNIQNNDQIVDFIAVKMGDLNATALAGFGAGNQTRSAQKLSLELDQLDVVAGQTYSLPVMSSNFNKVSGLQFTLNFDAQALRFEGVEAGELKVNESNFGTQQIETGKLTASWNNASPLSASKDQVLFTLKFTALSNTAISSAMTITSDITAAEAYDENLSASDVVLNIRKGTSLTDAGMFELYQNNPNPFAKQTNVSFRLPEAMATTLTLYDVTGKVIRVYQIKGQKGMNSVTIAKEELQGAGMYYYQLDAAQYSATKRMIIME
ncbi:MAG TPA: cohesin domain-containing protein [Saprospiraceae bacterium]|nr:cohesin domain-containing protein [Saprospiraceae bacterium]